MTTQTADPYMPTAAQLEAFCSSVRRAFVARGLPAPTFTRGRALDALDAAWGTDGVLVDADAARAVIDPEWSACSDDDQLWLRDVAYYAALDAS